MAKYIARTCPKCGDYFGLVVSRSAKSQGEHPINGLCCTCGYRLSGWRLIPGRKRTVGPFLTKIPKLFR